MPEQHPGRRPPLRVLHGRGRAGVDDLTLVAAAARTCSASVIGLTNVEGPDVAAAWLGAAAAARERRGRLPVVGYEQGDALAALLAAGVRSIGPLTVWVR